MEDNANYNLSQVEFNGGDHVYRTGLIFRAGAYPDKDFDLSPEEMIDAVNNFSPVDLDYEHKSGPLNGKLGKLEKVWIGDDGWTLYGKAKFPKWVDENLDPERKVSCTWNRKEKKLEKLALTLNPRVTDAALMAAFAASEIKTNESTAKEILDYFTSEFKKEPSTWQGSDVIQRIHDVAAGAGAVCVHTPSEFVSKAESQTIQQLHDLAASNGAKCNFRDNGCYPMFSNEEQEKSFFGKLEEKITSIFRTLTGKEEPAVVEETPETPVAEHSEEEIMADKTNETGFDATELLALVKGLSEKIDKLEAAKQPEEPETQVVENSVDTEKEELKKALDAANAQLAESKQKAFQAEAEAFADGLVREEKLIPAKRNAVVALYSVLVKENSSKIEFSDNGETKEVDGKELLNSLFSEKVHKLTVEEAVTAASNVLEVNYDKGDVALDGLTKSAEEFAKTVNAKMKKKAKGE